MCNWYAKTNDYPSSVHAFDSKAARDEWVMADWSHRDRADADQAHFLAWCDHELVMHGDAKLPRSWDRSYLVWDCEPTADSNVWVGFPMPI